MSKKVLGCALAAGLLVLIGLGIGVALVGQYNGLVSAEQTVDAQWSQVENVYQRRADLIPNLVRTVQGSAEFEKTTLENVVEARSRVGQIDATSALDNADNFARFQQAQDALSSALSRLLVVVERYPELRSTEAFRDLMVQLEGTENRVAVERRRFNEVARDYNTRLKRVPTRWFVDLLGWSFAEKPYFAAQPGAETAPEVDFSFD